MSTEVPIAPTHSGRPSAALRWRKFCEHWRHSYVLIAAVFGVVWRGARLAIPILDDTLIMGGLHPIHVLILRDLLQLMWLPIILALALYTSSFWFHQLNSVVMIAVSALCACGLLAVTLLFALMCISL